MGKASGNKRGRQTLGTGIGYDQRIMSKVRESNIGYVNFLDLYNLAIGRFEWLNVEEHKFLSTRVLEESLIWNGNCLFFMNEILGLLALPSSNSGIMDVNNIPKLRRVSRPSGYHTIRTSNDSVLCFNDDTMLSFIPIIDYYANKMTQIDRTIEQNLNLQRHPKVIVTDQDNENSVKKMLENNQDYVYPYLLVEPSIIRNSELAKSTYSLDLSVEFIADKLRVEKDLLRMEYLTRLGINNTRFEKKERMTNQEINVNNEEINSYRYTALKCRKDACKQVNQMFGTNIDVRYAIENSEVVNDGTLHDNTTGDNISEDTRSKPTS